jgi:hypothetical protein
MPSPIGHAIVGAAIAWTADAIQPSESNSAVSVATIACAVAAAAPDLDLLLPIQHRTITHSVIVLTAASIVAIAVTGKVKPTARRLVGLCALAYASHLLLDWLAVDTTVPRGIQLFWPASDRWFISEWDLFRGTARRNVFSVESMRINALAILQEIVMLGPIAAAAWLVRVKALARFAPEVSRGHHAAE